MNLFCRISTWVDELLYALLFAYLSGPLIAQRKLGDFGFKLLPMGAGVIIGH